MILFDVFAPAVNNKLNLKNVLTSITLSMNTPPKKQQQQQQL